MSTIVFANLFFRTRIMKLHDRIILVKFFVRPLRQAIYLSDVP